MSFIKRLINYKSTMFVYFFKNNVLSGFEPYSCPKIVQFYTRQNLMDFSQLYIKYNIIY